MYNEKIINNLNEDIKNNFANIFPILPKYKLHYEGVSRMVMLDRYAQKDETLKTLKVGDVILTIIKNDPNYPSRGIGRVLEIRTDGKCLIDVEEQYLGNIANEFKVDPNVPNLILKPTNTLAKPLELFYEQIAKRVGTYLGDTETQETTNDFVHELMELNFIPAGRVLYGAGSGKEVTYFNCYVMPMPKDSREGIAKHREEAAEIMSRGGGVGTNGSTLRPKGAAALSVGGVSSGAVSWLNDLSQLTHLIEQGGSRRGAQMIMMGDWHPDVIEFIVSKMQNVNSLNFIKENFQSEIIINEVNKKMSFQPFDSAERTTYENIIQHKEIFDMQFVKDIEKKLFSAGTWKVNDPKFLTGANISITISDKFMETLDNNGIWEFKFPDNLNFTAEQKKYYDQHWHEIGDVFEWEALGYPVKTYGSIPARELWKLINFCATYSAEPGIFFLDRANKMTNAKGYGQKVVCTNPCGEQPLAPYSVCNLGAINLSNFVNKSTKEVLYSKLKQTVKTAVRMQDNIIDATPYFLEANKIQALGERRVGLGVMGLHDMLIWAGVRYGSQLGNQIIDEVFKTITLTAYETSIQLAKEKGSFSFLTDRELFIKSGFIQTLPKEIQHGILENGIRNSHLITVAPTGSTGTMVGCSTGLEPYFAFTYFRSGRLGKFMEVKAPIVEEWLAYNPEFVNKQLPEIFINTMALNPIEHADVQCIIQRWVDSSISKTVNAPKGYTVREVEELYTYLYKHGAKGGTVYVDGSRDSQVLSLEKEENLFEEEFTKKGVGFESSGVAEPQPHHVEIPVVEKNIGNEIGNTCPVCELGQLIDAGGCVTCNNCNVQVKCGL